MKSNNKIPVAGKEKRRRELFREEELSMNWTKFRGVVRLFTLFVREDVVNHFFQLSY